MGELCDVEVPVAHGFHWSENLRALIGPSASLREIGWVAWDERYVFAKSDDESGSWYIVDTSRTGSAAVETFAPASEAWSRRLAELGRAAPGWREVGALPRPWFSNPGCQMVLLLILVPLLAVVYWRYAIVVFGLLVAAILAIRQARRSRRAVGRPD